LIRKKKVLSDLCGQENGQARLGDLVLEFLDAVDVAVLVMENTFEVDVCDGEAPAAGDRFSRTLDGP